MRILFIAPLPPPINGQSKAGQVFLECLLEQKYSVDCINLSKDDLKDGISSLKRIVDIVKILFKVWKKRKGNDAIYFSLSESFAGNLKDLFIYLICYKSNSKIVVHMLGGAGMKKILEKGNVLSKINIFFLKRVAGIIVEGEQNHLVFSQFVDRNKVHIVPNFADDFLFVEQKEIENKFSNIKPLKILYLSNLIYGKGYQELAEAYTILDSKYQKNIELSFVGGFANKKAENDFLSLIKPHKQIKYLGKFIDGYEKKQLYGQTHIFCLPTYYPFEGQPISILEAYASGIVVITTNHSGIPYVFKDKVNGFEVEKKSKESLKFIIEYVEKNKGILRDIALNNREEAFNKYRITVYQSTILNIIIKLFK
jgi:glycosyltransferase involved in cell wall biosynthesis